MFVASVGSVWAQQVRKATDTFVADFDVTFEGDYNYQYILQENGSTIKSGPFTMKATVDDVLDYDYFTTIAVKGNYNLKGNHSEGYLDGPLTLDATLQLRSSNGQKENTTYTFRGNFKKGLPDGNFTVNYPSYSIKVNVNYKEGLLVGSYMVSGYDSDELFTTISGSLTNDSKPTGVWKFVRSGTTTQLTFSNGILVNGLDYDDMLIAKAKEFAAGTISEEQLKAENIVVKRDLLPMGLAACEFILHDGIPFSDMGKWDFSKSENSEYIYLERLVSLSADGIQKMKEGITTTVRMIYSHTYDGNSVEAKVYRFFNLLEWNEEIGRYWVEIDEENPLSEYCLGYPDWDGLYDVKVYFTEEQVAELKLALHEARMEYLDRLSLESLNLDICNKEVLKNSFFACEFDDNIVVCLPSRNDTYYYVSRDKFEEYALAYGIDGKLLLDITPESRYDIVKQMIANRDQETLERCKEAVNAWLSTDVKISSKVLPGIDDSKGDLPVIGYMVTDAVKVDSSRFKVAVNVDVAVEKVTSANMNTVRYKSYTLAVYVAREKKSLKIDFPATLKGSNFVSVKNDFDIIDDLDGKIYKASLNVKTLDAKIYETAKVYIAGVNEKLSMDNLKAVIAIKQELLATLNGIRDFVDMRKKLVEEDGNIVKQYATDKALVKAYKKYCETRDLSWTPERNVDKLSQYMAVQSGVHQYVVMIGDISSLDRDIADKCVDRKGVHKAYLKYENGVDFAWSAESQVEMLAGYIEMQKMLLVFISKLDEIDANEADIKEEVAAHKDINKAYFAYAKALDLTWSADAGVEALDSHIAIQQRCLEFAKLRTQVAMNHDSINKLKSKAPAIHKVYTTYFKECDLAWTESVDFATIMAVLNIQDRYLEGVENPNIEAINKQVKVEKIDNIEQALNLLSQN